jgi:hypothetical protein
VESISQGWLDLGPELAPFHWSRFERATP